jgi:hypothetical protein
LYSYSIHIYIPFTLSIYFYWALGNIMFTLYCYIYFIYVISKTMYILFMFYSASGNRLYICVCVSTFHLYSQLYFFENCVFHNNLWHWDYLLLRETCNPMGGRDTPVVRNVTHEGTSQFCGCEDSAELRSCCLGEHFMEPCDHDMTPLCKILCFIGGTGLWQNGKDRDAQ